MTGAIIGLALRHLLTFGGGLLVAKGVLDAGTVAAINSPEVIGALATIGGVVLSIWNKKKATT